MSPVPPEVWITRFVAPLGTSMTKYCELSCAPERLFTVWPLLSGTPKVAVTLRSTVMATAQPAEPEQSPPQPVSVQPLPGFAVSVTLVPEV